MTVKGESPPQADQPVPVVLAPSAPSLDLHREPIDKDGRLAASSSDSSRSQVNVRQSKRPMKPLDLETLDTADC